MACRLAFVVGLVLAFGACTTSDPGSAFGNLRCGSDYSADETVYDYGEDVVGHNTIAEAIEAFRVDDPVWQLRRDWHALDQGDASSSPVEFTDHRGWVYLSIDVAQLNGSWVVSGYRTCTPPLS